VTRPCARLWTQVQHPASEVHPQLVSFLVIGDRDGLQTRERNGTANIVGIADYEARTKEHRNVVTLLPWFW